MFSISVIESLEATRFTERQTKTLSMFVDDVRKKDSFDRTSVCYISKFHK